MAAAPSPKDAAATGAPQRQGEHIDGSRALLEAFQNPFLEELLEVVFASDCVASLLKSAVSTGKTGLLERLLKRFASSGGAPAGPAAAATTASIVKDLSAAWVEAAEKGDARSLQLLLDACTSSPSASSSSAAAKAAAVQLLDARDSDSRSALMLAVRGGHAECAQLLLSHHPAAQVAALDSRNYNAAMHAAEHGHSACLQLLLAHSPDDQVKAASEFSIGGCNALMLAALGGHAACLQLLLAHSPVAQVTAESGDYWGCWIALMFAVHKNHTNCAQLLLAHAPEAQLRDTQADVRSALQCAACYGAAESLQLLLAHSPAQGQLDDALHGASRFLERKREEGGSELGLTKCVELLAKGAMLQAGASKALLEVVRPINQSLAARALIPEIANEAMVGLALAAGGRGKRRAGGEGSADAAEPEAKAACTGP